MNTFGAFKEMVKELTPIILLVVWVVVFFATILQETYFSYDTSFLVAVLALVNILAVGNLSKAWQKLAIGGNILVLIYALLKVNIVEYSIFLGIVTITLVYLVFPYLRTEDELQTLNGG